MRGEGEIQRPGWCDRTVYGDRDGKGNDDILTEKALEVLPELLAKDDPWCLYVGFGGPHDPYCVPQRFLDMYDLDDVKLPPSYADEMTDKPAVYKRMREQIFGQLSEREVREAIRHFWAMCSYIDELFGKLMNSLEATGQEEDTLVLFCSDHGDYCGDHGLFAKGMPAYRGAYHVPAVIRWPAGALNPGRRVGELVSLVDFAPTFLELAGVEFPNEHGAESGTEKRRFSGSSLMPFRRDEKPAGWRDDVIHQCKGVELYYTQRVVVTATHKYVFNGFDRDELYDLAKDPDEMTNLADDPACQEIKRDMVRRMWRNAYREGDTAINSYITTGLAPWGPAEGFR